VFAQWVLLDRFVTYVNISIFIFLNVIFFVFQLAINLCAQNNRSCLNNGVCLINPNTSAGYCNCSSPAFTGAQCQVWQKRKTLFLIINDLFFFLLKTFLPCLTNPCLNNGTCSASSTGTIQCNCTNCYSGSLCQAIDYCCLQVCSPNGVCISGGTNSYTCICQPNYVGVNCTTFNPCAVLPCLNNGKLIFEEKKNVFWVDCFRHLCSDKFK
jgi:hypothetical protein